MNNSGRRALEARFAPYGFAAATKSSAFSTNKSRRRRNTADRAAIFLAPKGAAIFLAPKGKGPAARDT
jgi:hypothetical protein